MGRDETTGIVKTFVKSLPVTGLSKTFGYFQNLYHKVKDI
jgi:hypothetical protein